MTFGHQPVAHRTGFAILQGSTGMTRSQRHARRIALPLHHGHQMKKLAFLAALVMIAAPLSAQDTTKAPTAKVAGNWDFSFTSPQGAATWRIKFDQAGDTLRGSAATDFGQLDVTDGWITGNDMSFTLNLNFNGQAIAVNFAGKVKGDTVQGNVDVPGAGIQPFPFTAIKAAGFGTATSPSLTWFDRPRRD
jgi:hypothetical protein